MTKISLFVALLIFTTDMVMSSNNQDEDFIEQKIQAMSLEEKIAFIGGFESFNIRAYEQYGIPQVRLADGPVGVRNFGAATAFPASINLAASFDKKMAYDIGKAIGMEARARNAHILLGPGMNIYRLPLCGRNFEYLGEDPFLAGELASAYIQGMQNQGVMACAKHYAANNQEFNRHHCSSDMDERTLHEIYLPAFKKCVQQGKVATVMTAYNLINGIHASEHDYLNNQILKGKWGFDGFIMSDWVSTYDGLACAKGGLDLEMPSGKMMSRETLIPAIENGALQEEVIDDKVRRILRVYQRFDLFEHPDISKDYRPDHKFVSEIALEAARGGVVLLKNEESILPLQREAVKRVTIIGPNAAPSLTGGGGSSWVMPEQAISLVEAVGQIAGEDVEVTFEKGIFTGVDFPDNMFDDFDFYVYENNQKRQGVKADYYLGRNLAGEVVLSTFYETLKLVDADMWKEKQIPETNFSARFSCFFRPDASGYYSIGASGDDGYRVLVDDVEVISEWRDQGDTRSKYDAFLNGGQEYKVVVEYYQAGGEARICLGATKIEVEKEPAQYHADAVAASKDADVVILAVGFNNAKESEAFDRSFEMPFNQSDLINKISEVNKNIVVVLNAGGNVEMESWIHNTRALVMAWYPGQSGSLAVAEILFGVTNPSGKLPASFANTIEEYPTYASYFDDDEDLRVTYKEGLFMGYRHWDKTPTKPRFAFGYGLSYTTFDYRDIRSDKQVYRVGEPVNISVTVKNSGKVKGAEVVQLYVADKVSSLPRPLKELKEFAKVHLEPGEESVVTFTLGAEAFSFYNPDQHDWEVEPGAFEILIGGCSDQIEEVASITITSD